MRIKTWSGSTIDTRDYRDKEKIIYRVMLGWKRHAIDLQRKNKKLKRTIEQLKKRRRTIKQLKKRR